MFAQQVAMPTATCSYLPPAVQAVPSVQTISPAPVANVTASIFSKATSASEAYAAYAAQSQNSYIPAATEYATTPSTYVSPAPVVETFAQAPMGYATSAPVYETISTAPVMAPAVGYTTSAPVVETISTAPVMAPAVGYATSAPVVETFSTASVMAPQPAIEVFGAPAVSYANPTMAVPTPQFSSYIPAPAAVETIVQSPSYIPAPPAMVATQVVSAPSVASYIPPTQMAPVVVEQFAPTVGFDAAGGQSVIVEQIGDWLVCEDALGLFFHHGPTQQSFDNAPPEFLMLFPQGYAPPPLGAFAASGMALQGAPIMVEQFTAPVAAYANPAPTVAVGSYMPPVGTYAAMAPTMIEQFAPTAYAAPPMVAGTTPFVGGIPSQLPPVMAKVLN